jgi:hypothetical protein
MPRSAASSSPAPLDARALDDLSYIRRTMAGAAEFTDVPGRGLVLIGVTAVLAAAAADRAAGNGWLWVWLAEALVAGTIGVLATLRKIRDRHGAVLPPPARKFLFSFVPALVAGAILTAAAGPDRRLLPGLWLSLYGVGVTAAGAFSVRAVPAMGLSFLALGALALWPATRAFGDLILAAGFGGLHLGFGWWIARRHGG